MERTLNPGDLIDVCGEIYLVVKASDGVLVRRFPYGEHAVPLKTLQESDLITKLGTFDPDSFRS